MTQSEMAALFKRYHAAKIAAAEVESLRDEIKALVLAEGKAITAGGFRASVTVPKPTIRFEEAAFAADHPDLYQEYKRAKPSTPRLNFR